MRKFNLLICAGAQKAGTTWLWENFRGVQGISTSFLKEIGYFSCLHDRENHPWLTESLLKRYDEYLSQLRKSPSENKNLIDVVSLDRDLVKVNKIDDCWYYRQFQHDANSSLFFDATPEYLTLPYAAIEHVALLNPKPKVIFVLRHPVQRVLSHIRMIIKNDRGGIFDENELIHFIRDESVLNRSRYEVFIPNWIKVFGEDNLKIFFYDQLVEDPVGFIEDILNFADCPELAFAPNNHRFNEGAQVNFPMSILEELNSSFLETITWVKNNFKNKYASNW